MTKHYKDTDGQIWGFDEGQEVPEGMVELTSEELAALFAGPPAQPRQFTSLELLDLFTPDEQLAVATAAMTIPQVKLWYDRLLAAQYVTIADARTEAGLSALVAGGLLTTERKSQIVAAMSA